MVKIDKWPEEVSTPEFITERLPFCGCGCPVEAIELYHWILAAWNFSSYENYSWEARDQMFDYLYSRHEGAVWAVMYALDKAEIAEHGSNISSSWLLPDGVKILKFLEIFGCDPLNWPTANLGGWYEVTEKQAERLNNVLPYDIS